jgi:transcription elongation factor Elf1
VTKNCKQHGLAPHFKRPDGSSRCGKCASQWVVKSRVKKKERLVKVFGGECEICGYKKYVGALDFHHKNRATKSFSLSVKGLCYSWESIMKEAKKCMLLCKNCHAEVEHGITKTKAR